MDKTLPIPVRFLWVVVMAFALAMPTAVASRIDSSEAMVLYAVGLTWIPVWLVGRAQLNEWVIAGLWTLPLVWLYGSLQGLFNHTPDAQLYVIGSLMLITVFMQLTVIQEVQGFMTGLYAWLTLFGFLPTLLVAVSVLLMLEVPGFGLVLLLVFYQVIIILVWAIINNIWDHVREQDDSKEHY